MTGPKPAWQVQRAYALLKLDRGLQGPGWDDQRVADAYGMTVRSLESWRKQAVEQGPESLLEREYPPRPQTRKLDGKGQAQLITLACSRAPDGRDHWTLRLLAQRMVELETVDSISHETVRRVLKKQPEAVAEAAMVYCPGSERGVCLPDGAGAGAVSAAL